MLGSGMIGLGGNPGSLSDPMTTNGDIIARLSGVTTRLAVGDGVLEGNSGSPAWSGTNWCMLLKAASQAMAASTVEYVTYGASDTELADPDDLHDPSTNNTRITIAAGGLYAGWAWGGSLSASSTNARFTRMIVNRVGADGIAGGALISISGNTTSTLTKAGLFWLTAGDYVEQSYYLVTDARSLNDSQIILARWAGIDARAA